MTSVIGLWPDDEIGVLIVGVVSANAKAGQRGSLSLRFMIQIPSSLLPQIQSIRRKSTLSI